MTLDTELQLPVAGRGAQLRGLGSPLEARVKMAQTQGAGQRQVHFVPTHSCLCDWRAQTQGHLSALLRGDLRVAGGPDLMAVTAQRHCVCVQPRAVRGRPPGGALPLPLGHESAPSCHERLHDPSQGRSRVPWVLWATVQRASPLFLPDEVTSQDVMVVSPPGAKELHPNHQQGLGVCQVAPR